MIGLVYLCEINNITYKNLAKFLGITSQTISTWINAGKTIKPKYVEELAKKFNISEEYITKELTESDIKIIDELIFNVDDLKPKNNWDEKYDLLKIYVEENEVKNNLGIKDTSLCTWVYYQRESYRNSQLHPYRIKKLNELKFSWIPKEDNWDEKYEELIEYKNKFGDCNVLHNNKDYYDLNRWLEGQRKKYNEDTLRKDRREKLESLNLPDSKPVLRLEFTSSEDKWNIMYNELKLYISKTGSNKVPINYEQNYLPLGKWIYRQKRKINHNELLPERLKLLNDIGFDYSKKIESIKNIEGINQVGSKWHVFIKLNTGLKRIGSFDTRKEAIIARRNAEIIYYGKSDINLDDF